MNPDYYKEWIIKTQSFERDAHEILSVLESSNASRVVVLEEAYDSLALLNIKQDDMMRQALRCAENGLYRAAHVMAWAACMDYIEDKLSADNLVKLRAARPSWPGNDIHEMAEHISEYQLVETLKVVGLATKNETKALLDLLRRRNECAHPTGYLPQVNETLGYIAEILQRIARLAPKNLVLGQMAVTGTVPCARPSRTGLRRRSRGPRARRG
jgi:hypothetical protein